MAPSRLVRGHIYRRVQTRSTAPSLRAIAAPGKPICWPASSTGCTAASFMPASMKRKSTTSALIEKPVHHILLRPSVMVVMTRMLGSELPGGLVQKRQLVFVARDVAGREPDEAAQAAREMRLVEVAGLRGYLAGRKAFAQQHR